MTTLRRDDLRPWLQLAAFDWLGETLKCQLIKRFGHPAAAFAAPPDLLAELPGWSGEKLQRFVTARKPRHLPEPPERLWVDLEGTGILVLPFDHPQYPERLREIPDAPVVLYALGDPGAVARPAVAVVGARRASAQGLDTAHALARDLAAAGFAVVSGLALGVDTLAHKGALAAGGATAAVLGGGVDVVHPVANRRVRDDILAGGGVLFSEFAPGSPPLAWHFPLRNRIIAGLALGVVVVEGTGRSGALITARCAQAQDRDVFAVPGSIRQELAVAPNELLKRGATAVTSATDIIACYTHMQPALRPLAPGAGAAGDGLADPAFFSPRELDLLRQCAAEPVTLDQLLALGHWSAEELYSLLLALEMRHALVRHPGNLYQSRLRPDRTRGANMSPCPTDGVPDGSLARRKGTAPPR